MLTPPPLIPQPQALGGQPLLGPLLGPLLDLLLESGGAAQTEAAAVSGGGPGVFYGR